MSGHGGGGVTGASWWEWTLAQKFTLKQPLVGDFDPRRIRQEPQHQLKGEGRWENETGPVVAGDEWVYYDIDMIYVYAQLQAIDQMGTSRWRTKGVGVSPR